MKTALFRNWKQVATSISQDDNSQSEHKLLRSGFELCKFRQTTLPTKKKSRVYQHLRIIYVNFGYFYLILFDNTVILNELNSCVYVCERDRDRKTDRPKDR